MELGLELGLVSRRVETSQSHSLDSESPRNGELGVLLPTDFSSSRCTLGPVPRDWIFSDILGSDFFEYFGFKA